MKKLFHYIEHYFFLWVVTVLVLGMLLPSLGDFTFLLKPALMLMLFFVFLKINLIQILHSIRRYGLIIYVCISHLIILPVVYYFLIKWFDPNLALAVLLMVSMPSGLATPALTDLFKGNVALSMGISVLTTLLAPVTIPLLFKFIAAKEISVEFLPMFTSLVTLVFVPMVFSEIIKKLSKKVVKSIAPYSSNLNLILLLLFVFIAMNAQRDLIFSDPSIIWWQLIVLYFVFISLKLVAYLLSFGQSAEDRIALTAGRGFMNNGLGIVLAAQFFPPSVLIFLVLSEIPWMTLVDPFKKVARFIK